jgi:hypothetical protein
MIGRQPTSYQQASLFGDVDLRTLAYPVRAGRPPERAAPSQFAGAHAGVRFADNPARIAL